MTLKHERVVMSLHGIRTRGVWQKDLVPELARAGFIPYALDYDNFGALKLLLSSSLDKQVEWLLGQYDTIVAETGCERPSVVAHSFGTLQVARLIAQHKHVQFDKVILAASIAKLDYPWVEALDARRVHWVLNEFGGRDVWPRVAQRVVPNAGESGSSGFAATHRALHQIYNEHHRHSDYFSKGNFSRHWVPTLLLDKRSMVDQLHGLIGILKTKLGLPREQLRAFVYVVTNSSTLKIVPGLSVGAASIRELELAIPLDQAGPGAAPALAFKLMKEVGQGAQDLQLLAESFTGGSPIADGLQWAISMPIPDPKDAQVKSACGVLTLDGFAAPTTLALADSELSADPHVFNVLLSLGKALAVVPAGQWV